MYSILIIRFQYLVLQHPHYSIMTSYRYQTSDVLNVTLTSDRVRHARQTDKLSLSTLSLSVSQTDKLTDTESGRVSTPLAQALVASSS